MNRFGVLLALVSSVAVACDLKGKDCRNQYGEGWSKDGDACECYCGLDDPRTEEQELNSCIALFGRHSVANGSCEECVFPECDPCGAPGLTAAEIAEWYVQVSYADGGDCMCKVPDDKRCTDDFY